MVDTVNERADGAAPDPAQVRRGRLMLIALAVVFLGPVVLAFVLYFGVDGFDPGGDVSKGELLVPTQTLPSLAGVPVLARGRATAEDPLQRYWNLVHVSGDGCRDTCREALADSAKVRSLLAKEVDRISRVLMTTAPPAALDALTAEYPDLIVVDIGGDDEAAQRTRELLAWDGSEGVVHIVDPRGNLVLRYAADMERMAIFQDLKRLLKLSRIG